MIVRLVSSTHGVDDAIFDHDDHSLIWSTLGLFVFQFNERHRFLYPLCSLRLTTFKGDATQTPKPSAMTFRNPWCNQFEVPVTSYENSTLFLTNCSDQRIWRIDGQNVPNVLDHMPMRAKNMSHRIGHVMVEQQRNYNGHSETGLSLASLVSLPASLVPMPLQCPDGSASGILE